MIKLGCQTFTWEMLGSNWTGAVEDIVGAVADAGYAGIEMSNVVLGDCARNPATFRDLLASRDLDLVAYAFSVPSGFTDRMRAAEDKELIAQATEFLTYFPGAMLSLGSPTVTGGAVGDLEAIDIAATIFNHAGAAARQKGVEVAFHPSSHRGSVLVNRDQYDRMMRATDPALIGWVPDTGHLLRGGHDIRATLSRFRDRIAYLHLKDADSDGRWTMMGQGTCGIAGVVSHLVEQLDFQGWIVAEEEALEARGNPADAVRADRHYLADELPSLFGEDRVAS